MKKSHLPPKGNTLIIASYKAIKLPIFHKLVVKLWLTEDDDLQKYPLIFIQIHSFKSGKLMTDGSKKAHAK